MSGIKPRITGPGGIGIGDRPRIGRANVMPEGIERQIRKINRLPDAGVLRVSAYGKTRS